MVDAGCFSGVFVTRQLFNEPRKVKCVTKIVYFYVIIAHDNIILN